MARVKKVVEQEQIAVVSDPVVVEVVKAPVKSHGEPDGVKYTKAAPAGEPGSDGKGNLFKYATNDGIAKVLESQGWAIA